MSEPRPQTPSIAAMRQTISQLNETVETLLYERDERDRRRRRNLLAIAVMVSVVVHISLLIYWSTVYRQENPAGGPQPVSLLLASETDDELSELDDVTLTDVTEPQSPIDDLLDERNDPAVELEVSSAASELELSSSGALPTLGGSGGDSAAQGLSGGGAGTTFFGVQGKGRRFCFIVDRSGSMGEANKLAVTMNELSRSIQSLPDYAFFYVMLFSSNTVEPPMQNGWMPARRGYVQRLNRWLNMIDATGGTLPYDAFAQAFALDVRPDVIFFLTDGEISSMTAEDVASLNRSGKRVVINTIAFGDPASQELLKQIAAESGGVYRYVATGGF
jgi:hypothetical protein